MVQCKIKMQALKNTRRKRKDPQSRDFTCRCGKTYLSYAAAYTHVKNKHQLDKQFLDDIGKPPREKLPRGRPKEKKEAFTTKEIQRLSIIEDTILKIHEILSAVFPKMILEGNKILSQQERQQADQTLIRDLKLTGQLLLRGTLQDHQFIQEINRHFAADIAAKVKFVVLAISEAQSERRTDEGQSLRAILNDLSSCNFWSGHNEVNQMICDSYLKWKHLKSQ